MSIHDATTILIGIALMVFGLLISNTSSAQTTITYTDREGIPTEVRPVPPGWDGVVHFRIQVDALPGPQVMATNSVLIEDSIGGISPFCISVSNGMTVAASSPVLTAAPLVQLTGRAYDADFCIGIVGGPSNPIDVEFVPEAPSFLAPTSP